MKNLVIIDNYDSFTFNLVHYIEPLVDKLNIMRNDQIDDDLIRKSKYLLLSPGPGLPKQANQLMEVIHKYHTTHVILGVCLGHQALAQYFGAELKNLTQVKHGINSKIEIIDDQFLFKNLPTKFDIAHYHSWVVKDLPKELLVSSYDSSKNIMSFRHRNLKIFGIQFHPESILTQNGLAILKNWININ